MNITELKNLLQKDSDSDAFEVDAGTETALQSLIRTGLPEITSLRLTSVTWAGIDAPHIESVSVGRDGTLHLEAKATSDAVLVRDPALWDKSLFTSEVDGHGPLEIQLGACISDVFTSSHDGETVAKLYGWKWSANRPDVQPTLWAAPVKFSAEKEPFFPLINHGNMLLAVDSILVRSWRFELPQGPAFLVNGRKAWYLVISACGRMDDFEVVSLLRSTIGFVFGAPFQIGPFHRLTRDGAGSGIVHCGLGSPPFVATSQRSQTATVPYDCHPTWVAQFVEQIVGFALAHRKSPLLRSINLHFASAVGFMESQFLHAWIALELLARWGIENNLLPDAGDLRLADHNAWLRWVNDNEAQITAHATPGMEQRLLSRVRGAEIDRPTKVQRAFRGLKVDWSPEMDDAEKVRHSIAHEGSLSDGPIALPRDEDRVSLVNTMFSTLLAELVGYKGPLADRQQTSRNMMSTSSPAWWNATQDLTPVEYRGRGIKAVLEASVAALDRLERDHAD